MRRGLILVAEKLYNRVRLRIKTIYKEGLSMLTPNKKLTPNKSSRSRKSISSSLSSTFFDKKNERSVVLSILSSESNAFDLSHLLNNDFQLMIKYALCQLFTSTLAWEKDSKGILSLGSYGELHIRQSLPKAENENNALPQSSFSSDEPFVEISDAEVLKSGSSFTFFTLTTPFEIILNINSSGYLQSFSVHLDLNNNNITETALRHEVQIPPDSKRSYFTGQLHSVFSTLRKDLQKSPQMTIKNIIPFSGGLYPELLKSLSQGIVPLEHGVSFQEDLYANSQSGSVSADKVTKLLQENPMTAYLLIVYTYNLLPFPITTAEFCIPSAAQGPTLQYAHYALDIEAFTQNPYNKTNLLSDWQNKALAHIDFTSFEKIKKIKARTSESNGNLFITPLVEPLSPSKLNQVILKINDVSLSRFFEIYIVGAVKVERGNEDIKYVWLESIHIIDVESGVTHYQNIVSVKNENLDLALCVLQTLEAYIKGFWDPLREKIKEDEQPENLPEIKRAFKFYLCLLLLYADYRGIDITPIRKVSGTSVFTDKDDFNKDFITAFTELSQKITERPSDRLLPAGIFSRNLLAKQNIKAFSNLLRLIKQKFFYTIPVWGAQMSAYAIIQVLEKSQDFLTALVQVKPNAPQSSQRNLSEEEISEILKILSLMQEDPLKNQLNLYQLQTTLSEDLKTFIKALRKLSLYLGQAQFNKNPTALELIHAAAAFNDYIHIVLNTIKAKDVLSDIAGSSHQGNASSALLKTNELSEDVFVAPVGQPPIDISKMRSGPT